MALITLVACALSIQAAASREKTAYPQFIREIPPEFRGRWDELNCGIREVRYRIEARRLFNFEANYEVVRVTVRSPDVIAVKTFPGPEVGKHRLVIWTFRLVQKGGALSGPDGKPPFVTRCS